MALLNPVDQAVPYAARAGVRLNWRLLLALGATLGFWATVIQSLARLFHG